MLGELKLEETQEFEVVLPKEDSPKPGKTKNQLWTWIGVIYL